jgi:hypothetical protein
MGGETGDFCTTGFFQEARVREAGHNQVLLEFGHSQNNAPQKNADRGWVEVEQVRQILAVRLSCVVCVPPWRCRWFEQCGLAFFLREHTQQRYVSDPQKSKQL